MNPHDRIVNNYEEAGKNNGPLNQKAFSRHQGNMTEVKAKVEKIQAREAEKTQSRQPARHAEPAKVK